MEHKLWVYIQDGKITEGPRALPRSWRNISGLHLLGETTEGRANLAAYGWYPWDNTKPNLDFETHKVSWDGASHSIVDSLARPSWTIETRDTEKEKADKIKALLEEKAELKARLAREAALLKYDGGEIPEILL